MPRLAGLVLAACALSGVCRAEAVLEVSGSGSLDAATGRLAARVTLANRGDRPAGPIDVEGELLGERRQARLSDRLAPGAQGTVELDFPPLVSQPGLHALTLLLEHPLEGPADAGGNPPTASQRGYLLLALGASPGEAVRVEAPALRLDVRGVLHVRLASRDGQQHRVRLRVLTPRGLRPEQDPLDVDVPPRGEARVEVGVVRAGAPRGSRQALLLVAETPGEPLARTSVGAAAVEVLPELALVPGLRQPLLAGGLVLVALAIGYEAWARRDTRRTPSA